MNAIRTCIALAVLLTPPLLSAEPQIVPSVGFDALPAVTDDELAGHRGADGLLVIVSSSQEMSASVTGASFSAGTMNNGTIHVGDRAFEGFSGLGVNVFNTGNGNAFSTGVSVSIHLH